MDKFTKKDFIELIKKYRFVLLLLLLLLSTIPYAYAKYISDISGNVSASVDKVYYELVASSATEVDLTNKTATYYFNVNNFDSDNNLNEVLMKYYLLMQLPPVDSSSDCGDVADVCQNTLYKDSLKAECPVTCGYTVGLDSINFTKHLYYKNNSNNWIEISANTTGDYAGYYTGKSNLIFTNKEIHEYKFVVSTDKDIILTKDYPFTVKIKVVQTKN